MRIGWLGYGRRETRLIDCLEASGHVVEVTAERIDDLSAVDLAISFGYRFILSEAVLQTARRPVLNLHISYLPWNRGAHPNFWSWVEGTPAGVTIHEITAGVDTGAIVFQKLLDGAGPENTLRETHAMLTDQIQTLFEDHLDALLDGSYRPRPQDGKGSYHAKRDLPDWVDWDMTIADAIRGHGHA